MKWQTLIFYLLFIFKKTLVFLFLALLFFPILETLLRILINKSETNFWTLYGDALVNLLTINYNPLISSELTIANLSTEQLFFNFFGQSFWLLLTILIPSLIISFIIGTKLALHLETKAAKIVNELIKWLNFLPVFLLIPLIVIAFVKMNQNTTFIPLNDATFYTSLLSFIPLWLSLFLPICLLLINIVKNLAIKHIKSDFYILMLALGKNKVYLVTKVILKNVILDFLPYLMSIYALALSFSFIAERTFNFNGQSFILNFAFNRGEVNLIVFALLFNIGLIYLFQVIIRLTILLINPLYENKPKSKYDIINLFQKHKIRKLNVEKGINLAIKK